jgi:Domain of unknown function (DUF4157)
VQAGEHEHDELKDRTRKPDRSRGADRGESGWLSAVGNKGLGRLLGGGKVHRSGSGAAALDETVSRAIHAKRGGGQPLDAGAQRDLGGSMGHDFSDVHVHTDGESDRLNRAVRAEAFTTGKDIFFREGKYDPGSSQGRKLLAHELTHVVQQRDAPPKQELTLSDPGDASERQAGAVADAVASPRSEAAAPVGRQAKPEEEKEEAPVARQAGGEEEEQAATSPVAREGGPEEEEQAATSRVDRAEGGGEEEEEKPA